MDNKMIYYNINSSLVGFKGSEARANWIGIDFLILFCYSWKIVWNTLQYMIFQWGLEPFLIQWIIIGLEETHFYHSVVLYFYTCIPGNYLSICISWNYLYVHLKNIHLSISIPGNYLFIYLYIWKLSIYLSVYLETIYLFVYLKTIYLPVYLETLAASAAVLQLWHKCFSTNAACGQ